MRDGIFVSYAHADGPWLARLQHVFEALPGVVRVSAWDDTQIAPGARWQGEIAEALETAAAAVLLLSPAFFRSEFIAAHELPAIVAAADRGELKILPIVLAPCAHGAVTATYQSVHDPARPLEALDDAERAQVWQRLLVALAAVAATVDDEARIGAETVRLGHDVAASPDVAHVLDKMARAAADPVFEGHDAMRENTLVFLEGQRCQAVATRLMEEMKRDDLSPARSKAVVRMLEKVQQEQEIALRRASELTRLFADDAMAMLQAAKAAGPSSGPT